MRMAAAKLNLSQPALSKQLQALQEYFPNELFTVVGKKKVLTPYGLEIRSAIQSQIRSIPASIEAINNKYKDPKEITLSISGRLEILRRLMNRVSFAGNLHFVSQQSDSVVQNLLDRKIDIAISNTRPNSLAIHSKPLLKDRFCLLLPKKWKISEEGMDLFSSLKNKPYIGYSKKFADRFPALKEITGHRTIEDWEQIIKLVESNIGWAVVPSSFSFNQTLCKNVPIDSPKFPENQFYFLYAKDNLKYDWFKEFLNQLSKAF